MNTSRTRIVVIASFALVILYLLWFVDYDAMVLTGFNTNPKGFGSLAFKFIQMFEWQDLDEYSARNAARIVSQILPPLLAWRMRSHLECAISCCRKAAKN